MTKKILWFSRHKMSEPQFQDLKRIFGDVEITQVNGTAANVYAPFEGKVAEPGEGIESDSILLGEVKPLKDLIKDFDEVAAVLPIGLVQQILPFTKGRLLTAITKRELSEDGKATFVFDGWDEITEVKIVTNRL